MFTLLGKRSRRFCDGVSRRDFLMVGGSIAGGLTLSSLLRAEAQQGISHTHKSLINIFLPGGPPHQDLWDLKPDAPAEIKGPWGAISTVVPGTQVCEKLPKMAQSIDRVALIRSMTHAYNNHSNHYTLTGYPTVDFTSETSPRDNRHHPFFVSRWTVAARFAV